MTRLEQLLNFLSEDPSNSFVRFALAKEYEGMGKKEDALNAYESLRTDDPSYVGTYYHYAKLLETDDRIEDAIKIYKEGMAQAKSQGDQHAHGEMATALWEIED